jgi:hypothetical protein
LVVYVCIHPIKLLSFMGRKKNKHKSLSLYSKDLRMHRPCG